MGTDARGQMIDAAERLTVERGIGAMSLRAVQAESGQRNKSAAQYHFGSRDGLIEAVLQTRMAPINERRQELVAALPPTPDLHDVVAALVVPLAEASTAASTGAASMTGAGRWARFLFQAWADPVVQDVVRRSFEASAYRTVRALLVDAVDHLPPPVRERRVDQAVGLVVMSLAASEHAAASGERTPLSPAEQTADLIEACCGLLAAPAAGDAMAAARLGPTTSHGRPARTTQEDPC